MAETSSLVAMESLACGTPVVAFGSGALPEIIEHGRTGFVVSDVRELAEALRDLFHRNVDLVVLSAVKNPYFRESIERSRTLLYAA